MSTAELYRAHIEALTVSTHAALEAEGFDAVAIHSGRMVLKSSFDDQDWPFRPVPELEHWAKVDWPDATVHVVKGSAPRLVIVRRDSFWERLDEPDWALIQAGIEVLEVGSVDEAKKIVAGPKLAFIGHDNGAAEAFGAAELNPAGLVERLHDRRTLKTDYEIGCMAEASRLAARGHMAARDAFHAGETSELAIHLAYLAATGLDDPQTPYKNIVALNEAAAVLHHIHYRTVDEPLSLLIDAGANHRGYCSDITRTYAAAPNGEGTRTFGDLIARMDSLQSNILERIEVGSPYESLHDTAHELMGALLVETDLYQGSAEAAVETGVTRKLFPHGLGHSLGVQVHDVGMKKTPPRDDNRYLRNTSTITAGQVFTIEPGLYFIDTFLEELRAMNAPMGWAKIEAMKPFGGIRIEDNIFVQADGIRNLTREHLG